MDSEKISALLQNQREYFAQGHTLPVENRIRALNKLKAVLELHEDEIYQALEADLGKSRAESYMCEVGMVYSELNFMLRHCRRYSKRKLVCTPLAQTAAVSFVQPSPKGNVLIMSPWNYPLMLTLDPLVDAIAAGNTALLKPSAYAPHTSHLIEKLMGEAFDPGLVAVVTGGRAENQQLLDMKFDHIFFTGSAAVGKTVLHKAADHLTPVSLELGGKSPCIVDSSAKIRLAARRIVFGKFLNCGQTCVAPDYVLCDGAVRPRLEQAILEEIRRQFGQNPLENENYGKIINQKHFDRLQGLYQDQKLLCGGQADAETLRIAPTVLADADWNCPAMQEEIFGPVLPILSYQNLDDALAQIAQRPHPLALYIFSQNKKVIRRITTECAFGGGCVNDTIIHLATSRMGFGGFGESGMGAYHGKIGFEAFSHNKSIVDKKTWMDLPMRYQPYTTFYEKLVRLFMR